MTERVTMKKARTFGCLEFVIVLRIQVVVIRIALAVVWIKLSHDVMLMQSPFSI